MATTKNITMKQFNGTDYDTLLPMTGSLNGKTATDIENDITNATKSSVKWDLFYTGAIPATEYDFSSGTAITLNEFRAYLTALLNYNDYDFGKIVITGSINGSTTTSETVSLSCLGTPLLQIKQGSSGQFERSNFKVSIGFQKLFISSVSEYSGDISDYYGITRPRTTDISSTIYTPVDVFSPFVYSNVTLSSTGNTAKGVVWAGVVKLYGAWKGRDLT